jgi:hypothetical protein
MKNQSGGIGEYSASPAGQGCLWMAAIGVLGVLTFSYMSAYGEFPHDPLDRVENGIAAVSRPVSASRYGAVHAHRRHRRRVVYRDALR